MGEIIERIPHKSVAYAFLEVRASSANEFEALRAEALKRAPHYGFAASAPKDPKDVSEVASDKPSPAAEGDTAAPSAPASDTPTEGLSPREKAKAKLAAKKGA